MSVWLADYIYDILKVPSLCPHCGFITIIQIYGCKETPVGLLYAEKMAELVLLSVIWIGLSASPLLMCKFWVARLSQLLSSWLRPAT